MSKFYGRLTFLLFLYFLLSFGYIFNHGFYSHFGSFIVLISIILFIIYLLFPKIINFSVNKKKFIQLLLASLFINIILTFFLYGGLYQTFKPALTLSRFLLKTLLIVSIGLILGLGRKYLKTLFITIFCLGILLHFSMIFSSPNPKIDVYDYLYKGALGLVKGQNPYSMVYEKMYRQVDPNYYSYLPFMLFLTLPFVILFYDPRFAFVTAQILIVYFLTTKFKWKNASFGYMFSWLIALLIFFQPLSLYMTEESYTEPLVLLEMILLFYCLKNKKKLSGFFLGISLATKQYLIFLLPFLFKDRKLKKRDYLKAFFVLALALLPFMLWNLKDFIQDVVLLQHFFPPRYEGLTFFSFLFHNFKITYFMPLAIFIWLISGIFLFKIHRNKNSNFILEYALFLLIFFFFNKWAFINYYYLISNLFLLAIYTLTYENSKKKI